jgi:hypothetical protein
MDLPTEIVQSNGRVAEVRIICDNCGKIISASLMPIAKVEEQRKTKTICQQCKEKNKP